MDQQQQLQQQMQRLQELHHHFGPMIFLGVFIFILVVYIIPLVRIISKAGYSGFWALIVFVPLVNIIMLWVFAFSRWPSLQSRG